MNEKFKYRHNSLSLINGILLFILCIAFAWSNGLYDWRIYVFWLGSIFCFHIYFSYRKYFLLIDDEKISFNRGLWKDKKIVVNDIERVEIQKRYFLLKLKNGKTQKLYKLSFEKDAISKLESILNSFN
ncbi:EbsA family protein [Bernardetia sp. Wsw4-3y2]|uniref:EbsA family protein n=1 Tax=Bernardetia sp. Wsw4-3y2 TaxID=3127471 RepID=UPI0030D108C3